MAFKTGAGPALEPAPRPFTRLGSVLAGLTIVCVLSHSYPLCLAQENTVLVGSGSTVPLPFYRRLSEEYNKRNSKLQMRYLPVGTSEGINNLSRGAGDFAAGEAPLTAKEQTEGNLVEVPIVLIGIVPIYNLPGIKGDLHFSGGLLADIFLGRVKTWNSPSLAKINSGLALPDLPIKVVYRPGGKGTNYVFTEFLSKTSPRFRAEIGATLSPHWPIGEPAERSSDMAGKVGSTPGSIGYVEVQYAVQIRIPFGSVLNPAGHFVKASKDTIVAACRAVESPGWDKFSVSLTNAPGPDSFPITSFSWLYLRTTNDVLRTAAVTDLLKWMLTDGQRIAAQEGYSELPPPLAAEVKSRLDAWR
ncbi:MAG TPA: phosphate ABC transporter substrate-binding protein PstS [Terriglobales bacterium]|nr:phosphate ABC transporter substrate-binding protein PstS [Terriglobales bacterium]